MYTVTLGTPALQASLEGGVMVLTATTETVANNMSFFFVLASMWGVIFIATWLFRSW